MSRKGLTITEVLVVVTILVVVSAIIAPVFFRSKKAAFATVCTSNLHQLSLAMQMYRDDHGDYPPNNPKFEGFRFYYPQVLHCPESKNKDKPVLRMLDYLMVGSIFRRGDGALDSKDAARTFASCREVRNAEMPIAFDLNHREDLLTNDMKQGSFLLIAREGGQIEKVPAGGFLDAPCDTKFISELYNR